MKHLMLSFILSSYVPFLVCQSDLLADDFAAPIPSLSESHYPHTLQTEFDDAQTDYGESLPQPYHNPAAKYQLITKNVYVHIPPNEPEYQPVKTYDKPIPKRHYNIVFIKAPAPPKPIQAPEPIQNEHKTLIYVLVKKPEPLPRFETPQEETTEPSKPEVFFVKYKGE